MYNPSKPTPRQEIELARVILNNIKLQATKKFINNGGAFVDGDKDRPMLRDGASAAADYAALVIRGIYYLPKTPRADWMQLIELGAAIERSGLSRLVDVQATRRRGAIIANAKRRQASAPISERVRSILRAELRTGCKTESAVNAAIVKTGCGRTFAYDRLKELKQEQKESSSPR